MANDHLSLMAHLMRRAGFGATREELERRLAAGYEATVEDLLHPEAHEPLDFYDFLRYLPMQWKPDTLNGMGQSGWVWRMINTKRSSPGKDVPLLAPDLRDWRLQGRSLRRSH